MIALVAVAVTACGPVPEAPAPDAGPTPAPSTETAAPAPPLSCAEQIAASLSPIATAAQLLVIGAGVTDPVGPGTDLVGKIGPGGVLLTGRSSGGVAATADRTGELQQAAQRVDDRIGMLVAADQEGGEVQTLAGPGFTTIPPATEQGGWSPADLTEAATRWAGELRASGVNLDLAPVADVLRADLGRRNLSVGVNHRTFGTLPDRVGRSVVAFLAALRSSGVAASVKHFPGLGQVPGNTDHSADVRDTVTRSDSPSLEPFRAAVENGVPVVMVSSAIYTKIDAGAPAAFSPRVVDDLLRGQLGFTGVVISDDLGRAAAVARVPPADRATRFVAAGGDLVLTADPAAARPMLDGLVARMTSDAGFAERVAAAARRVLALKQVLGLLRC